MTTNLNSIISKALIGKKLMNLEFGLDSRAIETESGISYANVIPGQTIANVWVGSMDGGRDIMLGLRLYNTGGTYTKVWVFINEDIILD